ncbi:flippase [uncultured Clostridium sp.]|uniref:flippase n=1 Tax=uncultured Clostridium sp. TaxID=59620 RepID=UPI0028E3FE28|nr:flippase [uncultured Clostridium sp.]
MTSVKKNFAYETFLQMLMVITPLLTAPYIARIFGPEKNAIYSYTYSVAYYFSIFAMLGIESYGNRSIAGVQEDREKRSTAFSEIYAIQLITSVTLIIFYIIYVDVFVTNNKLISFLQIFSIMSTLFNINWFFWGMEEFRITVIRSSIIKLCSVISIFIFVRSKEDLWIYTLIMSTNMLIQQIIVWFFIPKYIDIKIPKVKNTFRHFKPNLILFLPVISLSMYTYLDKVMLGNMGTMLEVGFYASADRIIDIPMSIIYGIGIVMLPRMSKLFSEKKEYEAETYINNSLLIIIFISTALMFGISSIATEFVPIFFGNGYEPCINITILLTPVILIKAWSNVIRTQYLIPQNKNKEYISSVLIGAIINFIFNYLLIPRYGVNGVVVGTLIAEFSVAIINTKYINKYMNIFNILFKGMLFLIDGIIMMVFIEILKNNLNINSKLILILIEIITGSFIYCILSIVTFKCIKFQPFYAFENKVIKYLKSTNISRIN